ncbi:MAG: nitrogen fixation protein NifZ [Chromatiales bacterium]|jgi:nitrogen fixation protein NifZ|nr:nitrogen fixation protein NifZ [Chromatiales bacterium]MDX9767628.1 nitrogen fixation protein NifZ [Ectothiorhodospiraceae bacterium]
MLPRFDFGEAVRVIRNVRNDGTWPGRATGELLVRRGAVGFVQNVGTFLQDQLIYSVHFLDQGIIVGCREEELIGGDEPWTPSRFEFREKVRTRVPLAVGGEVIAPVGRVGQVVKVLCGNDGGQSYHVLFQDRVLCVPEQALEADAVTEDA